LAREKMFISKPWVVKWMQFYVTAVSFLMELYNVGLNKDGIFRGDWNLEFD
jgi:hypothetical protein